jgi:demethylmenaquinone methyltransferase/2-methoxy-6-polyprenyl-1,4-benzoquinol methylase
MNESHYTYNEQAFRKWAPFYNLIAMPLTRIRDKVVSMSGARVMDDVLDFCTGTGSQAFAFGRRGCNVIGIDLSTDMLNRARRLNRYENIRFEIADATKVPFPNKRFDIACVSMALHDMPREMRHQVLEEMKRVSQRVVVVDYHIPNNKVERWFHVSFTSLYEGKYYRDYARQDLDWMLRQHGLKVIGEGYGLINFIRILVCET